MKILVDEEGRAIVGKLIDTAVRSGAFQSLQEAILVAKSVSLLPNPGSLTKKEEKEEKEGTE